MKRIFQASESLDGRTPFLDLEKREASYFSHDFFEVLVEGQVTHEIYKRLYESRTKNPMITHCN